MSPNIAAYAEILDRLYAEVDALDADLFFNACAEPGGTLHLAAKATARAITAIEEARNYLSQLICGDLS